MANVCQIGDARYNGCRDLSHAGPASRRMVTLQDVAREAGVAVSTASRALTQPERISPPTRARVQEVARRLGYRPNRIARAVVSGRTQMLAVLVPDITNPHHFGLIRGAEERARAADRTLVLGDTRGDPGWRRTISTGWDRSSTGSSSPPAGFRTQTCGSSPDAARSSCTTASCPAFPVSSRTSTTGCGRSSGTSPELGHRRVAYLSGPRRSWSEGRRWAALAAEATRAGVVVARLGPFAPTLDGGPAAADAGLASGATALVAYNDLLAIGVLRRLEERGVPVPQTVSVTGFDDIFGADFCHPPLTTVTAPTEEAGRVLVDVLLGGRAPDAERIVLPVRLQVRGSTGPAR